jgi:hypothetical protein
MCLAKDIWAAQAVRHFTTLSASMSDARPRVRSHPAARRDSVRAQPGLLKRFWFGIAFFVALAGAAFAQVPGIPVATVQGIPITASSGNVAAATATATLAAGGANRTTYICGFAATSGGATAAAVVNLTVTNIVTGTMSYTYGANTGAGVPTAPLVVQFNPCLPANAANTTIVVSMPSLGTGNTNAAVNAWGFQR